MTAVLLSFAALVQAQSTAFTYQGRLSDGAYPANGTYEMTFTLHSADSGAANQLGSTSTNTNVQVANGIFTVELDFGSEFPGPDRWLEISVKKPAESGYTTLTPRQKLNSVPYAVRAAGVSATAGDSVVGAINDAATTAKISPDRVSGDFFRLTPSLMQFSTPSGMGDSVLDLTGRQDIGDGMFTDVSRFRLNTDGGFFVSGTAEAGSVPTTGGGSRMMWYPGKWAFRAGKVDSFGSTYWDEGQIGYGSMAFGENVRASGNNSFAANLATTASGAESVALGNNGTASADRAFAFNGTASAVGAVAIGSGAQATGDDSLAMGPSSIAGGLASVTIGPSIANGNFAVAIGLQNRAGGQFSMALGKNASTCSTYNCSGPGNIAYQGTISISDASASFSSDALTASANNQINMRGSGGIRLFTSMNMSSGVTLSAGGSAWNVVSDRNAKENIIPVNTRDILRGVLKLPISTWNYKTQDSSIRHIGAMAQDFKAAFEVGESDKTISTIDPDGVALAAIQGLNEELKDRDKKLELQGRQLNGLQEQVRQQQTTIDALKKLLCSENPGAEVCK